MGGIDTTFRAEGLTYMIKLIVCNYELVRRSEHSFEQILRCGQSFDLQINEADS
jgi:hypothetical protein